MGIRGRKEEVLVIKPIGWRQVGFTLFLLTCSFFFAFVDFLGLFASWAGTITLGGAGILSLLDQLFEWSRLRVDRDGYHLRGWWRRLSFQHREIERFELAKFANRPLIAIVLTQEARERRGLQDPCFPFPCSFGRPMEEVIEKLRGSLRK